MLLQTITYFAPETLLTLIFLNEYSSASSKVKFCTKYSASHQSLKVQLRFHQTRDSPSSLLGKYQQSDKDFHLPYEPDL